jgi:hypothetical protein
VKLGQAADIITEHPVALQLRTLQTMAEISIEKNSTIIFPAQFMTTVQDAVAQSPTVGGVAPLKMPQTNENAAISSRAVQVVARQSG